MVLFKLCAVSGCSISLIVLRYAGRFVRLLLCYQLGPSYKLV